MGLFSCFHKKQSPEEKFWGWFMDYGQEFISLDGVTDKRIYSLLDPLSEHLKDYCEGLVFEIGYDETSNTYELVISADGDKKLFPQVERLAGDAPVIKNWKVTAFRQPKDNKESILYQGYSFDPAKIFFHPLKDSPDPTKVNIEIVYADYEEINRNLFLGGTFLLLDALIGEKSTELDIAHLDVSKIPDNTDTDKYELYPLSQLGDYIKSKKQ